MSNIFNDNIRERAQEAMENAIGSAWEKDLAQAIKSDDLERMREVTKLVEDYLRIWEAEYNDAN